MKPKTLVLTEITAVQVVANDNIWTAGHTVDGQTNDAIAVQIQGNGIEKSVFDTATPSEFVQVRISMSINVFDTTTPTEFATVAEFMKVNVFDTVSIAEVIGVEPAFVHQWNVLVPFSEPLFHVWDVIVNAAEMLITHEWKVFQLLGSVTHAWRVLPLQIQTLFDGSVQLIMNVVDWSVRKLYIADDVNVQEHVSIRGPSFGLSVFDAVNVTEFVAINMSRRINVFDSIIPAEDVRVIIPLKINVFDTVGEVDVVTIAPLSLKIDVSDAVIVTESVTITRS